MGKGNETRAASARALHLALLTRRSLKVEQASRLLGSLQNNINMKTDKEKFPLLVAAFEAAIIDRLLEQAEEGLSDADKAFNQEQKEIDDPKERKPLVKGVYRPATATLLSAAFPAFKEVVESEAELVSPMLAVAVWEAVMKTNESAFRQSLERKEKAGTLGFKVAAGGRSAKSLANEYL